MCRSPSKLILRKVNVSIEPKLLAKPKSNVGTSATDTYIHLYTATRREWELLVMYAVIATKPLDLDDIVQPFAVALSLQTVDLSNLDNRRQGRPVRNFRRIVQHKGGMRATDTP